MIDATGVNAGSGGMTTYLRGLLRGWAETGYQDEILVAGMATLPKLNSPRSERPNCTTYRVSGRGPLARLWAQQVTLPALARASRAEVWLSTDPSAPLVQPGRPVAVTVHDLRHRERPEEFSMARRAYRSVVWSRSIRRAAAVLTNSMETADIVRRIYPVSADRVHAAPLGADHVLTWDGRRREGRPHAIAFAHWSNKRPQLAIEVWAAIFARATDFPLTLLVVGASGRLRTELRSLAVEMGVADVVEVTEYLADAEFQRRFASASLVLNTSTLEGFGLPIVEAMMLGIPVVVSPALHDSEASGRLAVAPESDDAPAFATAILGMFSDTSWLSDLTLAARKHATRYRWENTAGLTRAALHALV